MSAPDRLRDAVGAFLKKYDECLPYVAGAFTLMMAHGGKYTGPNWAAELDALRALVRAEAAPSQAPVATVLARNSGDLIPSVPNGGDSGQLPRPEAAPPAGWQPVTEFAPPAGCEWTADESGEFHTTACGGMFGVGHSPRTTAKRFCYFCGKQIVWADPPTGDERTPRS